MDQRGKKDKQEELTGRTESIKLSFESAKQLTTLNAGSILVIGTFLRDIFPSNIGAGIKFLIALSFISFAVSLVSSILAMFIFNGAL